MATKISKRFKRILISLPGIVGLSIFPIICTVSDKKINEINMSLKETINIDKKNSDSVTDVNSFTNFSDYNPIYSSKNTSIMNNKIGTIGTTKDNKTIILTTYSGMIAWANNLTKNQLLVDFYKSKNINDINNYEIKSMVRVPEKRYNDTTNGSNNPAGGKGLIGVLFGDKSGSNQVFFFLDEEIGKIYIPPNGLANDNKANLGIIDVGSNNEYLFLKGNWTILITKKGTSSEIGTDLKIVSFSDRSLGISTLEKRNLATSNSHKFVGFSSGNLSINNKWDFMFFLDDSTRKVYAIAVDNNLHPIKSSSGRSQTHIKYEFDTPIQQTTKNGQTTVDVDNLFKFAYPRFDHGADDNNTRFVYTVLGENQKTYDVSFNGSAFTLKTSVSIKNEDKITNVLFDGVQQHIYYTIDGKDNPTKTVLGHAPLTNNSDNQTATYDSLKQELYNPKEPFVISLVDYFSYTNQNSSNNKHIFMVYTDNHSLLGYYKKQDNTLGDPNRIRFSKHNDPVKKMKSENLTKTHTASLLASNPSQYLTNFLEISGGGYNVSIENAVGNDDLGTLSFNYKVQFNCWWGDSPRSFKIPISLDGFYIKSKISVKMVINQSIDATKFQEIEKLKKEKYSSQITDDEIINHFITSDIKDKDGNALTIEKSMIRKQVNGSSLIVTVNLPSNKFPSGIPSSLLTYTDTFYGFKIREGYDATIKDNNSQSVELYKKQYPSYVKKVDIINSFIDFNNGQKFNKNPELWDISYTTDDYSGTLTLNSIQYTLTENSQTEKIVVSNRVIEYTGFKKIYDEIDLGENGKHKPSIVNPSLEMVGFKTPVDIWNEYTDAINSGDINKVSKTLLISSLSFPLVASLYDLNIVATNIETANDDHQLDLRIEIKDNAKLNIRHHSSPTGYLEFNEKIKNYITSNGYPFTLNWKIESNKSDISWNIDPNQHFKLYEKKDVEILEIDLYSSNWEGIDRNMTVDEFLSNESNYKNAIANFFDYSDIYKIVYSTPILNKQLGLFTIRVDFELKNKYYSNLNNTLTRSFTKPKEIIIKGFNIPASPLIYVGFVLCTVIAIVLICLITYMVLKRSHILKQSYDKKPTRFSKKIDRSKYVICVDDKKQNNQFNEKHDEKDIKPKTYKKIIRPH